MKDDNKKESLINLLENLNKLKDGNIYQWECLITYPIINMAVNIIDATQYLCRQKNFICAVSLTRSLAEIVMVFVYDCTAQKPNDFYKQFVENGRLMKLNAKNKWEKLGYEDLISHFEKTTKLGIRETYNNCCDILHFSIKQLSLLGCVDQNNEGVVNFKIGKSFNDIPKEKYDNLIKFSNDCEDIIRYFLKEMIKEKSKI